MATPPHHSPDQPGEAEDDGRIHLGSSEAREKLAELLNMVRYQGHRFVVDKHGTPVAAVVPLDDLEHLENLEDEADREALAELDDEEMETVPIDEVEDELFDDDD